MNQYEFQPYIEPQPPQHTEMNTMGLVGMILGIAGFMFAGITSIPGLIFSIKGMKHPSNGFAIAGLVLNIVGILIMLFWIAYLLFFLVVFGMIFWMAPGAGMGGNMMNPSPTPPAQAANEPNMLRAQALIQTFFTLEGSTLPTQEEFQLMIGDQNMDSHGRILTYFDYSVGNSLEYQIISDGPDMVYGTDDDIEITVNPYNPPTHSKPLPLIRQDEVDLDILRKKKEEKDSEDAPGEVEVHSLE